MKKLSYFNVTNHKIFILIFLLILYILIYLISLIILKYFLKIDFNNITISNPLIQSNSSIVFYIIAGKKQKLNPDLRGKFWEFQLNSFTGKYWLEYLSDGPLFVNGINFTILPFQNMSYDDSKFCIRTPESWLHFMKYHSNVKWYLRGTHDTFINLTSLNEMINEFEKKIDPMKEFAMAYNVHEYNNIFYPQGGTGWLFSHYTVKKFAKSFKNFKNICENSFDDVALTYFFKEFNLSVNDWKTNKFIVTFPNTELNIIKYNQWNKIKKCPINGYNLSKTLPSLFPGNVRSAVCIHMHKVPMNEVWDLLKKIPNNIGVTFPNPNYPTFCKL